MDVVRPAEASENAAGPRLRAHCVLPMRPVNIESDSIALIDIAQRNYAPRDRKFKHQAAQSRHLQRHLDARTNYFIDAPIQLLLIYPQPVNDIETLLIDGIREQTGLMWERAPFSAD